MNKAEIIVFNHFKENGHLVKKLNLHKPDFIIDNEFYVEVKNLNSLSPNSYYLSRNQVIDFSGIFFRECKDIFIYYVKDNVIFKIEQFTPIDTGKSKLKTINVTFEDEEIELLNKAKGDDSWREFIMTLVQNKKKR